MDQALRNILQQIQHLIANIPENNNRQYVYQNNNQNRLTTQHEYFARPQWDRPAAPFGGRGNLPQPVNLQGGRPDYRLDNRDYFNQRDFGRIYDNRQFGTNQRSTYNSRRSSVSSNQSRPPMIRTTNRSDSASSLLQKDIQFKHHLRNWARVPKPVVRRINDLFDFITPPMRNEGEFRTRLNSLKQTLLTDLRGLISDHLNVQLTKNEEYLRKYNSENLDLDRLRGDTLRDLRLKYDRKVPRDILGDWLESGISLLGKDRGSGRETQPDLSIIPEQMDILNSSTTIMKQNNTVNKNKPGPLSKRRKVASPDTEPVSIPCSDVEGSDTEISPTIPMIDSAGTTLGRKRNAATSVSDLAPESTLNPNRDPRLNRATTSSQQVLDGSPGRFRSQHKIPRTPPRNPPGVAGQSTPNPNILGNIPQNPVGNDCKTNTNSLGDIPQNSGGNDSKTSVQITPLGTRMGNNKVSSPRFRIYTDTPKDQWRMTIRNKAVNVVLADSNFRPASNIEIPGNFDIHVFPGCDLYHTLNILKQTVIPTHVKTITLAIGINNRNNTMNDLSGVCYEILDFIKNRLTHITVYFLGVSTNRDYQGVIAINDWAQRTFKDQFIPPLLWEEVHTNPSRDGQDIHYTQETFDLIMHKIVNALN